MEAVVLGMFGVDLAVSVLMGVPTVYALLAGLVIFCLYARRSLLRRPCSSISWRDAPSRVMQRCRPLPRGFRGSSM